MASSPSMLSANVTRASKLRCSYLGLMQASISVRQRMCMSADAALASSSPSLLLLERLQSHSLDGVSATLLHSGALPWRTRGFHSRTATGCAVHAARRSTNAFSSDNSVVSRRSRTAQSGSVIHQPQPPGACSAAADAHVAAAETIADPAAVGRPSPFADADARSVYLHSPWCKNKCHYCDFPVVAVGADGLERPAVQSRMQVGAQDDVSKCSSSAAEIAQTTGFLLLMRSAIRVQEYVDLLLAEIDAAPHIKRDDKVTLSALS